MKAKGIRLERETVVVFNEEEAEVSIWTASDVVYRKLTKLGYKLVEDSERSASFKAPKKVISFRGLPKKEAVKRAPMTEEHKKKLQKARLRAGASPK